MPDIAIINTFWMRHIPVTQQFFVSAHPIKIRNQWNDETIGKRVWSDANNSPIPVSINELLKEQYCHKMEDLYSLTGIPEVRQWLSAAGSD